MRYRSQTKTDGAPVASACLWLARGRGYFGPCRLHGVVSQHREGTLYRRCAFGIMANCPRYSRKVEYDHYKCSNTLLTIGESDYRHTFKNAPRKFIFNWDASCTMINDEPCYAIPKKPEGQP
jgi:hypothetical protein